MQIENAENATLISKHLNEIERNSVLNLKKDLGRFLKKYNEVLISLRHCTEVRFANFFCSNSFIFEPKVENIYMGVFSTHFVPLISNLAPKILEA